jgi:MFS family permease
VQGIKALSRRYQGSIKALVYRYTTVSDPLWILLVEPLHGVTFACRTLAAVHYAAELAPPGLEVSAQGLGNTVNCLGVIAGSVIGGRIMQEKGSVYMYRAAGGLAFVTLVVYLLVTLSYLGLSSLVEVRSTSDSSSSKARKAGRQEQDACASLEEPPQKTADTVLFKRIELEDL